MSRFRSILLFSIMAVALAVPSFAKNVFVAVLETVTFGTSISKAESVFLTDKLRSQAVQVLPDYKNFVIMTSENIRAMLPPDRSLEECEGGCLVETGKNIFADYVAQARVGQFGSDLTLTVELYETASGKMLASYTSKNSSVEELLTEIEGRSAMLFGTIPGAVTANAGDGGEGGISDLSGGRQWSSSKVKKQLVEIESQPSGALLNVDGRPQSNCRSTPCTVELTEGNHKFTFVLDKYFDLDTIVMVKGYMDKLKAKMQPNFGELVIDPEFPDKIGNRNGLAVYIDGEAANWKSQLAPGKYTVVLQHNCYEDVRFAATIVRGKTLRYTKEMIPRNGHVSISARQDDTPKRVPVYVNDQKAGMTPFDEDVSVCAVITVGEEQASFPEAIRAHQETEWVYEVPEEEKNSSGKIDSGIDTENESKGSVRFFVQGLLGIATEGLSEERVEDEDVLWYFDNMGEYDYWATRDGTASAYTDTASIMLNYLYGDILFGIEISQFFTIGAGAGIGMTFLASDDETLDKDLPGFSLAPNISLEASIGTEYVGGVRYRYIFDSRWPSLRISGFFEWLNTFGLELGSATTSGLGQNFFLSLYGRFPTRGIKELTKKLK